MKSEIFSSEMEGSIHLHKMKKAQKYHLRCNWCGANLRLATTPLLQSHRCVASVADHQRLAEPNMKVTLKKESNISVMLRRRLCSCPNSLPKPFVVAEIALNILTAADSWSVVV